MVRSRGIPAEGACSEALDAAESADAYQEVWCGKVRVDVGIPYTTSACSEFYGAYKDFYEYCTKCCAAPDIPTLHAKFGRLEDTKKRYLEEFSVSPMDVVGAEKIVRPIRVMCAAGSGYGHGMYAGDGSASSDERELDIAKCATTYRDVVQLECARGESSNGKARLDKRESLLRSYVAKHGRDNAGDVLCAFRSIDKCIKWLRVYFHEDENKSSADGLTSHSGSVSMKRNAGEFNAWPGSCEVIRYRAEFQHGEYGRAAFEKNADDGPSASRSCDKGLADVGCKKPGSTIGRPEAFSLSSLLARGGGIRTTI